MPRVTAHAVTSGMHCMVHACRQAGHPYVNVHARNYLWTCRSCQLNDIYQKYPPHILAP